MAAVTTPVRPLPPLQWMAMTLSLLRCMKSYA
jgi:hypothetical protein